jgi:hypothetical protein
MRPADDNELMLKWFSGALVLSLMPRSRWSIGISDPSNAASG